MGTPPYINLNCGYTKFSKISQCESCVPLSDPYAKCRVWNMISFQVEYYWVQRFSSPRLVAKPRLNKSTYPTNNLEENGLIHTFPKDHSGKWKVNSFDKDLNKVADSICYAFNSYATHAPGLLLVPQSGNTNPRCWIPKKASTLNTDL